MLPLGSGPWVRPLSQRQDYHLRTECDRPAQPDRPERDRRACRIVLGSPDWAFMSFADLLRHFAHPLNQVGISYMATGAPAAVVPGEPRLALGLDLVLRFTPVEAGRLADAFPAADFTVPPIPAIQREAGRPQHGHFTVTHLASGLRGEMYLAGTDPLDVWGLEHRRQEPVQGEPVWMAPATYVIVRKLEYFRAGGLPKHLTDIQAMLRVRPDLVDRPMLERFVKDRRLTTEWALAQS